MKYEMGSDQVGKLDMRSDTSIPMSTCNADFEEV
jgi:hypothetical protein